MSNSDISENSRKFVKKAVPKKPSIYQEKAKKSNEDFNHKTRLDLKKVAR